MWFRTGLNLGLHLKAELYNVTMPRRFEPWIHYAYGAIVAALTPFKYTSDCCCVCSGSDVINTDDRLTPIIYLLRHGQLQQLGVLFAVCSVYNASSTVAHLSNRQERCTRRFCVHTIDNINTTRCNSIESTADHRICRHGVCSCDLDPMN